MAGCIGLEKTPPAPQAARSVYHHQFLRFFLQVRLGRQDRCWHPCPNGRSAFDSLERRWADGGAHLRGNHSRFHLQDAWPGRWGKSWSLPLEKVGTSLRGGPVVGWKPKKNRKLLLFSRKRGCGDHTKLMVKRNPATTHQLRLGSVSPLIYKGFSTLPGCLGFLNQRRYVELSTWI